MSDSDRWPWGAGPDIKFGEKEYKESLRHLRDTCLCTQLGTREKCQLRSGHDGKHDWEREP